MLAEWLCCSAAVCNHQPRLPFTEPSLSAQVSMTVGVAGSTLQRLLGIKHLPQVCLIHLHSRIPHLTSMLQCTLSCALTHNSVFLTPSVSSHFQSVAAVPCNQIVLSYCPTCPHTLYHFHRATAAPCKSTSTVLSSLYHSLSLTPCPTHYHSQGYCCPLQLHGSAFSPALELSGLSTRLARLALLRVAQQTAQAPSTSSHDHHQQQQQQQQDLEPSPSTTQQQEGTEEPEGKKGSSWKRRARAVGGWALRLAGVMLNDTVGVKAVEEQVCVFLFSEGSSLSV